MASRPSSCPPSTPCAPGALMLRHWQKSSCQSHSRSPCRTLTMLPCPSFLHTLRSVAHEPRKEPLWLSGSGSDGRVPDIGRSGTRPPRSAPSHRETPPLDSQAHPSANAPLLSTVPAGWAGLHRDTLHARPSVAVRVLAFTLRNYKSNTSHLSATASGSWFTHRRHDCGWRWLDCPTSLFVV